MSLTERYPRTLDGCKLMTDRIRDISHELTYLSCERARLAAVLANDHTVKDIAKHCDISPQALAQSMQRHSHCIDRHEDGGDGVPPQ